MKKNTNIYDLIEKAKEDNNFFLETHASHQGRSLRYDLIEKAKEDNNFFLETHASHQGRSIR